MQLALLCLRYILLYLVIISGAIFLSYKFNKKICQTLALSILGIILIVYIFGLIGLLKIGIYFTAVTYLALGVFSVFKLCKKGKSGVETNIYSGMFIFSLLYFVFALTTYNKTFGVWDEYSLWSIVSKNMYILDDFATNAKSTVFSNYPPSPAVLQYFFMKIVGKYSQGIELFASEIFGFTLLLPILKNAKRKSIKLITAAIIMFIPGIFADSLFYYTIYVDTLLGLLIGYILFEFFTTEQMDSFSYLSIIFAICSLTLIKVTGFFISIIIIGILFLYNALVIKRKNKKWKDFFKEILKWKNIKLFIILFLICFIVFLSWRIYFKFNNKVEDISVKEESSYEGNPIKYTIKTFYYSIVGNEEYNQDTVSVKTLYSDLFEKDYYSSRPINMSVATWACIFGLFSIYIYVYIKDDYKKKFMFFVIALIIGTIIYIFFLETAYIIEFKNKEAVAHVSLQRYMGTFLTAILFVLTGILIYNFNKNKEFIYKYTIVCCLIFLFTPVTAITNSTITAGVYNSQQQDTIKFDIDISERLSKIVTQEDRIYPVHQTSNKDTYILKFRYYMTPIYIPLTGRFGDDNILDFNSWKKTLYNNYDYVYILKVDDYFCENFKSLFESEEIKEWSLYKINKDDETENILLYSVDY